MPDRQFALRNTALLTGIAFTALRNRLSEGAKNRDLRVENAPDGSVFCLAGAGRFGAFPLDDSAGIFVEADQPDWLFTLQDALNEHFAEANPELAINWSRTEQKGTLPPNMAFARVDAVTRLSQDFWRIRLVGDELTRFCSDDGIHFRLLLPPNPEQPHWPAIDATGHTVWPSGDNRLHRAVYTVRACNGDAGWLDADIFIHEGGRTCGWAMNATGRQICIAGPGGGGVPAPGHWFICGDPTAYPAIARSVETGTVTGDVYLWGNAQYTISPPPGVTLNRVDDPHDLVGIMSDAIKEHQNFWVAGEKSAVEPLGKMVKKIGLPKSSHKIAAYWTR